MATPADHNRGNVGGKLFDRIFVAADPGRAFAELCVRCRGRTCCFAGLGVFKADQADPK